MDQGTLVDLQIDEGQRLIHRLAKEGVDVTAAAWVKESESGQWFLYLATPLVSEDGATRPAYRCVNALMRQLQKDRIWHDPIESTDVSFDRGRKQVERYSIDPLEIKLVGPTEPVAKAMVAHRDPYPGPRPIRFRGDRLGDLPVEEAYIYPPTLGRRVFVFEYRPRGQTTHWDAVSPGHCVRIAPGEQWKDGEVRVDTPQDNRLIITVYSDEALLEGDYGPAEDLADEELKRLFPPHTIDYPTDQD